MNKCAFFLVFAALVIPARGAPFQNLSFDEARTNDVSIFPGGGGGLGSTLDLLPHWSLFLGSTLQNSVNYDFNLSGFGPNAALLDHNPTGQTTSPFPAEDGCALLLSSRPHMDHFSLVQRGDVPQDATFLKLEYYPPYNLGLGLSLDGVNIPPRANAGVALYDVSAFAGQNVELRLTATHLIDTDPEETHAIDNIEFIPEPGMGQLFLLGGSGLLLVLRWRRMVNESNSKVGRCRA